MARLSPEKSIAPLSIEVAVTAGKKNDIDSSLIGAFDATLRQARRSEGGADLAAPSQERRSTDDTEAPSVRTKREDRETDRAASEDGGAAPVSERETRSNDEVESDKAATGPEAASDERTERTEDEKDAGGLDETTEDATDEAASDAEATDQAAVQEPVVNVTDPTASKEQGTEQVASGDDIVETAKESVGLEKTDSPSSEATAGLSSGQSAIDEATIATEATDEAVDATQQNSDEEAESESEQSTTGREKTGDIKSLEQSAKETESLSEESSIAEDTTAISEEDSSDQQGERGSKRRGQPTRGEGQGAAAESSDAQMAAAETTRGPQATSNPATSQLPDALEAATPEHTATSDLGAANSASQASGSADATTAIESRASAAQSQVAAGQGTGKGHGEAVDPAKFVQRVAKAFAALGQRSGPVRLKLYPPELGSLRMEITVKNGAMSARVEAETAAAKSVLLENLPLLRERLTEQGIKVDRFDVDVSDHSQGGPSERPDDNGRSSEQGNRETGSRTDARGHETNSTEQSNEQTLGIDGRLDVFI